MSSFPSTTAPARPLHNHLQPTSSNLASGATDPAPDPAPGPRPRHTPHLTYLIVPLQPRLTRLILLPQSLIHTHHPLPLLFTRPPHKLHESNPDEIGITRFPPAKERSFLLPFCLPPSAAPLLLPAPALPPPRLYRLPSPVYTPHDHQTTASSSCTNRLYSPH